MKEKKNWKLKKVRCLTSGPCDRDDHYFWKLIIVKYISLPFTLFELYGAVFIMNSKIHLRKNSSNEYFKTVSHYSSRSAERSEFIISSRAKRAQCVNRAWVLASCKVEQEGILYAHASIWAVEVPQRHFLWIVYVRYQHLQAVFWSWMTCIGCYAPQTCSSTYRGISTMKVSLL